MRAGQRAAQASSALAVERPRPPERAPALEGARLGPGEQRGSGRCGCARRGARRSPPAPARWRSTAHVVGQQRVQVAPRRRLAGVARHLAARVHAAVGAARHRQRDLAAQHGGERRPRARPAPCAARLARPAREARAVVLEQEPAARALPALAGDDQRRTRPRCASGPSPPPLRRANSSSDLGAACSSKRSAGERLAAAAASAVRARPARDELLGRLRLPGERARARTRCVAARPSKRSRTIVLAAPLLDDGRSSGPGRRVLARDREELGATAARASRPSCPRCCRAHHPEQLARGHLRVAGRSSRRTPSRRSRSARPRRAGPRRRPRPTRSRSPRPRCAPRPRSTMARRDSPSATTLAPSRAQASAKLPSPGGHVQDLLAGGDRAGVAQRHGGGPQPSESRRVVARAPDAALALLERLDVHRRRPSPRAARGGPPAGASTRAAPGSARRAAKRSSSAARAGSPRGRRRS